MVWCFQQHPCTQRIDDQLWWRCVEPTKVGEVTPHITPFCSAGCLGALNAASHDSHAACGGHMPHRCGPRTQVARQELHCNSCPFYPTTKAQFFHPSPFGTEPRLGPCQKKLENTFFATEMGGLPLHWGPRVPILHASSTQQLSRHPMLHHEGGQFVAQRAYTEFHAN